jgi:hypothetical protein
MWPITFPDNPGSLARFTVKAGCKRVDGCLHYPGFDIFLTAAVQPNPNRIGFRCYGDYLKRYTPAWSGGPKGVARLLEPGPDRTHRLTIQEVNHEPIAKKRYKKLLLELSIRIRRLYAKQGTRIRLPDEEQPVCLRV